MSFQDFSPQKCSHSLGFSEWLFHFTPSSRRPRSWEWKLRRFGEACDQFIWGVVWGCRISPQAFWRGSVQVATAGKLGYFYLSRWKVWYRICGFPLLLCGFPLVLWLLDMPVGFSGRSTWAVRSLLGTIASCEVYLRCDQKSCWFSLHRRWNNCHFGTAVSHAIKILVNQPEFHGSCHCCFFWHCSYCIHICVASLL